MAGNGKSELSSGSMEDASFVGGYSNGQRGNYPGASLDRSGSFREGGQTRTPRGSGSIGFTGDFPPLPQCLVLDPIIMSDQKCPKSVELRRALGFSFGSSAENNPFVAACSKPNSPLAYEELKRLKASIADACFKAKGRTKKLDESLHRLNKYCDFLTSKKLQQSELLGNERSGGSNLLKMSTQIHRNSPDLGTQRLEDRPKNVVLNKRVRTSLAETRGEGRSNVLPRQTFFVGNDRDQVEDGGGGFSDPVEGKIRRLSAGGEGWDKKVKRKRSISTVFTRPMDSDGELKRATQSCETHILRSGSYSGTSCVNKMDNDSLPANSNARSCSLSKVGKVCLSRDQTAGLTKERLVAKANKMNVREDNPMAIHSPVAKVKASRALRTRPVMTVNSSPYISRGCGALEGEEQPQSVNKVPSVSEVNNRKGPLPTGSFSPSIAQWVGQRPQKISRTRRANLVSPVSNRDEMQMSSESCPTPDFGARITSTRINGPLLAKSSGSGTQDFKVKLENVSSPATISENEDSRTGENRLKVKRKGRGEVEEKVLNTAQTVVSSVFPSKKNKTLAKEEIVDGARRQRRSGRGSLFFRGGISLVGKKLDNSVTTKPLRTMRPNSDKSGSKSGRPPLKKLSDRKAFTRGGLLPNSSSPDFTGESDGDREELLAAAKFACRASYIACSGSFWKKMEPIFASVSMEETSFLKQQLIAAEELPRSLSQTSSDENNVLGELVHEEVSLCQNVSKESAASVKMADHLEDFDALCGRLDSEMHNKVASLYQRVLSALIVEDEIEIFEGICGRRNGLSGSYGACLHVEHGKEDPMEYVFDPILGHSDQKQCTFDTLSCNGGALTHSDVHVLHELQSGLNGPQDIHPDIFHIFSYDRQYEIPLDEKVLLELQSIGLYPETLPDLAEGDDEVINQETVKLMEELCHVVVRKKVHLDKLYKAIEERKEMEGRKLEQVAMDRLVELAYRKQLATRGSYASKSGINKVPKQVALAFAKRTVARCQKFEDTGKSCFSEPALWDTIFPAPRGNDAESMNSGGAAVATNLHDGTHKPQRGPRASGAEGHDYCKIGGDSLDASETLTSSSGQGFVRNGPISNRGKKREVLLDDVGDTAALRGTSASGSTFSDGAEGKRSERDRDRDTLTRHPVAKAGERSVGHLRGERKTKLKPKQQKTAQLLASGNGLACRSTDATHPLCSTAGGSCEVTNGGRRKREVRLTSPSSFPQDSSTEIREPTDSVNSQLHELDSIEELGVGNDLGGNQDLSSWLNFEEDGLQDHDSMGLEIPMDDLCELNMLL